MLQPLDVWKNPSPLFKIFISSQHVHVIKKHTWNFPIQSYTEMARDPANTDSTDQKVVPSA